MSEKWKGGTVPIPIPKSKGPREPKDVVDASHHTVDSIASCMYI